MSAVDGGGSDSDSRGGGDASVLLDGLGARTVAADDFDRALPLLASGPSRGLPRVYDIALEAISHGDGRVDAAAPLSGEALITARTRQYVTFFHQRNLAGLRALLTDGFALEDPTVGRLEGKEAVLRYVGEIFQAHPRLTFTARGIVADASRSVIEFDLQLGDQLVRGTDVIEWEGDRLKELRAYLR
jgi:hypothetical protein